MIDTVLFDLDGTLLPMDQDLFIKTYFSELTKKMMAHDCEPKKLIEWVWAGTEAMIRNNGELTNREAFYNLFAEASGLDAEIYEPLFDRFYQEEFDSVQRILGSSFGQPEIIAKLRNKNYRVVLATAPVFPRLAVKTRLNWIGLDERDFDHITTYENCHYCKPNIDYYREIFDTIGADPQNSLMIGNNARDDMVVEGLGTATFLLTDYLEKTNSEEAGLYRSGDAAALIAFLDELPVL